MFWEVQSIEFSSGVFEDDVVVFSAEVSSFRVFDFGTPVKDEDAVEDAEFILFSSSGLGSGVEVGVLFSDRLGFTGFSVFSPIFGQKRRSKDTRRFVYLDYYFIFLLVIIKTNPLRLCFWCFFNQFTVLYLKNCKFDLRL